MLVARGKAGRISGMLEGIPADKKRVHQNDPLAEADAAARQGNESAGGNPEADVSRALDDVAPLLEPTAPPMPAALIDAATPAPEPSPAEEPAGHLHIESVSHERTPIRRR